MSVWSISSPGNKQVTYVFSYGGPDQNRAAVITRLRHQEPYNHNITLDQRERQKEGNIVNKRLASVFAALACMVMFGQSARAQSSLGAGVAYGGDIEAVGLEGRFYHNFSGPLRLAVNFTYFFPGDNFTMWTLDPNIHYTFANFSGGIFYGLGGLDIANAGIKDFDSDTELGLNLGAGIEGDVSFGGVFGELKVVLAGAEQIVITGGLRFELK